MELARELRSRSRARPKVARGVVERRRGHLSETRRGTLDREAAGSGRVLQARGRCVITGRCCIGGGRWRVPARRLSTAAVSILPGAALILLPKCPLCLAASLTIATGVGFSAAGAPWVRAMLVAFWVAAVALAAAATIIRHRRAFGRASAPVTDFKINFTNPGNHLRRSHQRTARHPA
jgi:hypothetical protein